MGGADAGWIVLSLGELSMVKRSITVTEAEVNALADAILERVDALGDRPIPSLDECRRAASQLAETRNWSLDDWRRNLEPVSP